MSGMSGWTDPHGILVVAEYGGHCVGIGQTFPAPRRDSGGCKAFALIRNSQGFEDRLAHPRSTSTPGGWNTAMALLA